MTTEPSDEPLKPSDFSRAGQPCCSIWGKTEIEELAWVYVTAMARNGDEWKPVTAQQCLDSVAASERRICGWELRQVVDGRDCPRWDAVANRLTNADGALSVGGFWSKWDIERAKQ